MRGSESETRRAVLHVGLDPRHGIWSAMRTLMDAQRVAGRLAVVAGGVFTDPTWPPDHAADLAGDVGPWFRADLPAASGTAQAVTCLWRGAALDRWVAALRQQYAGAAIVIHSHAGWRTGALLPRTPGTALVSTFHGLNPILARQPVRRWVHRRLAARLAARRGAQLTSVDQANLAGYEAILGLPAARFRVIPNGVPDTGRRGCPGLAGGGPFTVGYVGSLHPDKGWGVAAEAVVALRRDGCDVRLVVAGSGPDEAALRALAARHPGAIDYRGQVRQARDTVMPEFDLLALMSRYEAFPMTVLEALSLGVPVAATAVGDIPRQLADGRAGLLIPGDAAALAGAIRDLVADPARRRALGAAARQRYEAEYRVDRIVPLYDEVYTAALAAVRGGGRA